MIGRMRAGVRLDDLRNELNTIAGDRVPEFPRMAWASLRSGFLVDSLQADVTRGIKPALLAILGAVVLLLVIASVNVTNLLLARGVQRRGEFAMRIALGASRSRLLRQLLTESLLLAGLGGLLGLLVAELGVRGLVALAPVGLPRVDAIAINGMVLLYTFAVTLTVGVLVGLAPALHAHRSGLLENLQHSSRQSAGSHQFTRRTLVVVEVSLALVLLIGAGLLLRSLQRLFAVDPGFRASHLLTMQVQTSGPHFNNDDARRRFFEQAIEKVRAVPGVTSTAFTSMLPFSQQYDSYGAHFEKTQRSYDVYRYAVTPGYLETMGIALRRGRSLTQDDTATSQPVVLISETLARTAFPDGSDPIGQHVHVGPTNRPWFTVVGVVDDVRQTSLAENRPAGVYLPMQQSWFADDAMALVVRSEQEPSLLLPAVRQAIWSVDKDQPIARVATADDLLAASGAERRFAMVLFEIFAIVALILAATGIYGVLSGSVTERVREIGVRAALGASRGNILALLLRQGMTLTAVGVAIGLAASLATSRALITLLFGVSQLDPITYGGVVLLLLAVSAAACWIPAHRASRVDPSTALRAE
jgi:putative ABC transport system permease protein